MAGRLGYGPNHRFDSNEDEPTKAERADLRQARREAERLAYQVDSLKRTVQVAANLLRNVCGEAPTKRGRGRPRGS